MLGKAVIRQGWYWGASRTPVVGEGSGGALGAPRELKPRRGRALGVLGAFPPQSGRVPPQPHRPQRVDVDEAGGVGGFIVPLHVHAAERKAPSPGWGGRGAAFWEGRGCR